MQENKIRVYLSGKIHNEPNYRALFCAAAKKLNSLGFDVVNPAENPPMKSWEDYMKYDIKQIVGCDTVVVLDNWRESRGARIEVRLAKDLSIPVIDIEELQPVPDPQNTLEEANGLVHGDRQAAYGHPYDDYTCTADMANGYLRKKYGYKYERFQGLTAEDTIVIMQLVKISRWANGPKRDHMVDLAGYAECLWMVHQREASITTAKIQKPVDAGTPAVSLDELTAKAKMALRNFRQNHPGNIYDRA